MGKRTLNERCRFKSCRALTYYGAGVGVENCTLHLGFEEEAGGIPVTLHQTWVNDQSDGLAAAGSARLATLVEQQAPFKFRIVTAIKTFLCKKTNSILLYYARLVQW